MEITFLPTNTPEIYPHVEQFPQNTYWTLAEDLRLPKRQETPHVPGWGKRKKKKQKKNRDGTSTSGRELWRRKSFHTLGGPFTGGDRGWAEKGKASEPRRSMQQQGCREQSREIPVQRIMPTSTHQPERLVCSTAGAGWGWELRLGLWRSDPREKTGVGCMDRAWSGVVHQSLLEESPGESLKLPKRQETIVLGCGRRGNSEHHQNKLQRLARAAAISTDTTDGHEMLRLLLQPPRRLCASRGHYPQLPSQELVQPTRVLWSRDNFSGRTHGVPQAVAMSCRPLLPQAHTVFHTPPSPCSEWARAP